MIPADNLSNEAADIVRFLRLNHFNVIITDEIVNYMPLIQAARGDCHIQIAKLTPDGSNRDFIQHLVPVNSRLFVVFRGEVYKTQPVFRTVMSYLWSRFLRELGAIKHITPVIAVSTNSSCDAEGMSWESLRWSR